MPLPSEHAILRLPQVLATVAVSRSTLYDLIKRGRFPAPVKLGLRASGWPADEVAGWVAERRLARIKERCERAGLPLP